MSTLGIYSQPWFHGFIDRNITEQRLRAFPLREGKFLVRERSTGVANSIALSVVHKNEVIHYIIDIKNNNGEVSIENGPVFKDAVKLIENYQRQKGSLVVQLSEPCSRKNGEVLQIYESVTYDHLNEATKCVLRGKDIENENAIREFLPIFLKIISNILHEDQLWFHHITNAEDAKERLEKQCCKDGLFLIKKASSNRPMSFTLMLCHSNVIHPYRIEQDSHKQLSIQGGKSFDSLMELVRYYSNDSDGLLCKLVEPCERSRSEFQNSRSRRNNNILLDDRIQRELQVELSKHDLSRFRTITAVADSNLPSLSTGVHEEMYNPKSVLVAPVSPPVHAIHDDIPALNRPAQLHTKSPSPLYDLPLLVVLELDSNQLQCTRVLGQGYFGRVMKGTYKFRDGDIQHVAVKILNKDTYDHNDDFKKEADIMAKLEHQNIVKLIGICMSQSFGIKIVMELAPFGQLNSYVKNNFSSMTIEKILILMWQVNDAMHYLESRQYVHRDLAARNVLLMSESWVKVSDFGLSRALGIGKEYYLCEKSKNDPCPLHWYAPECLTYDKFSSKSDVWSFGVTMWEVLSYGKYPYKDIKVCEDGSGLIKYLNDGGRLKKPKTCPEEIYILMKLCWELDPGRRISFDEIKSEYYNKDYETLNMSFEGPYAFC